MRKMRVCNEDVNEDNPSGVKVLQDGQSARRCDKSLPSPASWLIYNLLLLPRLPMSGSTMAADEWRPSCLREIVELYRSQLAILIGSLIYATCGIAARGRATRGAVRQYSRQ